MMGELFFIVILFGAMAIYAILEKILEQYIK